MQNQSPQEKRLSGTRCSSLCRCTRPAQLPSPSVVLQPVLMSTGHTPMYTSAVSTLVRAQQSMLVHQRESYQYHHQSS